MSTEARRRDPRASIRRLVDLKARGQPIVAMTAYDVLFARLLVEADVDLVLVGDSLGPVVLGYDSTIPVTLDEMIHHARAVKRGAPATPVVLDMPFMSYHTSVDQALRNAGRAMKEAGVDAVKLEGGQERTCEALRAVVAAGIPAMGHIGPAPQSAHALDDHRMQRRSDAEADRIRREAEALQDAGVFSLVLERMPAPLAREISSSLAVPTVGIGAGAGCDGQVMSVYDALGLTRSPGPSFLKRFGDLRPAAREGIEAYAREVRDGTYPGPEHSLDGD